ncbi:hypothetical protein GCM10007108_08130 [Thermogymnomonas acidicola]|uniref:SAM-dependent methyltransferase TRM5/TYW2-type domain-containing protein n=1 Tax=Thermogymnomonas acidicola TaxID=399579 RepID=A0AA37BR71_9ARCH|nr:methyltransferase domain-containing protein [Thermogymnomonas acidicola]GGM72319.1 hypothetical protein GCM10007108_08130 [Thermogymnomonas acidicola]
MPRSLAVAVNREKAEETIRLLGGLVDRELKTVQSGEVVYIPVRRVPDQSLGLRVEAVDFPARATAASPYMRVVEMLGTASGVPRKYVRYGDALVFREEIGEDVARAYMQATGCRNVYVMEGKVRGEERIPSVRRILGPGGETVHRENGIRFVFDPERVMFSPGNVNIRVWASRLDAWGCTVLDMFSGIGYFTLPVAKYGDPERVIAVDINPMALDYLRKSAAASGIRTGIETVARDCRELQGIKADLILMGNFKSVAYLPAALRNMGGVARIFMHYLVDTSSLGSHATMVMGRLRSYGFVGEELHSEVVKSFAPHLWHVAALFRVRRTTGPLP